jgi:serine phosphatase RsbU (regulator of sigma subunit)
MTPLVPKNGSPDIHYIAVGFDVTARRRQEQNLERIMQEEHYFVTQLEAANAALEREVEEKIYEIQESIDIAQGIQQAMLPTMAEISELLPRGYEVAMLYIPRDLVSGDFYYVGRNRNATILALGDGTGHGVPGAFISMLGIEALAKMVEERRISDPGSILTQVDEELVQTLNQKSQRGSIQDSIDMAVLSFQQDGKVVQLSSAMQRSFFFTRNGLEEHPGTRRPVGGTLYNRELPFENVDLHFQPGDTLYLMSDGYQSQFGGAQKQPKQLGRRMLREQLMLIHTFDELADQVEELRTFLKDWRGNAHPQTDDISVLILRRNF